MYGRNGVILKRPASVTSVELKMEKMRAEVEQAKAKQQIAENMRRDFEKDRDKMKKVDLVYFKFLISYGLHRKFNLNLSMKKK